MTIQFSFMLMQFMSQINYFVPGGDIISMTSFGRSLESYFFIQGSINWCSIVFSLSKSFSDNINAQNLMPKIF